MTDDSGKECAKEKNYAQEEITGQKIAHYQVFLSAWMQCLMEKGKQILWLSSLAIGLLTVFYNNLNNLVEHIFWLASIVLFLLSIISAIISLWENSRYIEEIIRNDDIEKQTELKNKLSKQTSSALKFFIVGMLLSLSLVILNTGFVHKTYEYFNTLTN